jgi:hypothetical protein
LYSAAPCSLEKTGEQIIDNKPTEKITNKHLMNQPRATLTYQHQNSSAKSDILNAWAIIWLVCKAIVLLCLANVSHGIRVSNLSEMA